MEMVDIITIAAIIIGPIASVQIQKYLERAKETRNQRNEIFRVLMSSRGSVLSDSHVKALNQIDLVFEKKKYQNVRLAWGEYLDNLKQPFTDENFSHWAGKNEDLLADLLYQMGIALKHNYDKVSIKRNSYTPVAHADVENENQRIRKGILNILEGRKAFPMLTPTSEEDLKAQLHLRDLMVKFYELKLQKEETKNESEESNINPKN